MTKSMAKATMNPVANNAAAAYDSKPILWIIGAACVIGFLVDMFVLAYPANFGTLEWRASFTQQLADRSIIFLFGAGLLMAGLLNGRVWRKRLALVCITVGIIFQLAGVLTIRDSSVLQKQALERIDSQAEQAETRLDELSSNPELQEQVTSEQLNQLRAQLSNQADTLQGNAKTGLLKAAMSTIGNLVVVGFALIGLGRFGAKPPRMR